jgi:transposase
MTITPQIASFSPSDVAHMTDLEGLRQLVVAQRDQLTKGDEILAQRDQTIQRRDQLIDTLTEQLKRLRHLKFGASSERFDPSQQALFEETLSADMAAVEAEMAAALATQTPSLAGTEPGAEAVLKPIKSAPQKPVRTGFPEHLPRVVEILPASRCSCAECKGPLHLCRMEISEKLDVTPAVYLVRQRHYPVMACRTCEALYGTPTAPEIIDGGIPTAALLAHVTVQKYVDHLPLYRQSEIAKRADVHLPVSTLAEWIGKVGVALKPLVDYLRKQLYEHAVLHVDETPIQMLNPGAKERSKTTKRAYLFAYRSAELGGKPMVIFDFQTSRSGAHAATFLAGYTGALVVDDFAGYKALFSDTPMREVACWAHARRKFFELHKANQSPIAHEALTRIGALYVHERVAKAMNAEERTAYRQSETKLVATSLFAWLKQMRPQVSENSSTGNAMDYLLRREVSFLRFLEDGRYPIDNNAVENAIRPIALGRKNWLFAGSAKAGERAAAIMSLLATAKACGVNPQSYLTDVLTRLP